MIKRLCDIGLALFGLVFFLPLALLFALAVKWEDGGPVFYAQERWGRGGRKFRALKFRSMSPHAGFMPAADGDRRITRTGKWLRATAMDELPQLWNILKGDMSFVGPRALAAGEISPETPHFSERHRIRPGLTGPTQVYAKRDIPLEEKFRYDLEYVRHPSLWLDFKLMLLSVWVTVRGKWESRQKKI